MLNIHKINKTFGAETVLKDISFVVNPGDRVGLLGPNGCGKSTLFRMITGEESIDSGSISLEPGTTIGYLAQGLPLDDSLTVLEIVESGIPDWLNARNDMERISNEFGNLEGDALETAMQIYSEAASVFEAAGGYSINHKMEKILHGLGIIESMHQRNISELSGGQRTRVGLAKVLLATPDLLILDEPTNHLDIEALEWLEAFIRGYQGGVLLASHDRIFLDNTIGRVIMLNPETHLAREYAGNYTFYIEAFEKELAKTWQQWQDQQTEINRLEADIHNTKMHAESVELTTTSRQPTIRRYAKKVAKKALSREKKLERYLDSDDRVDKPKKGWNMKLDFEESMRSGQLVLEIEGLTFGYEKNSPILTETNLRVEYGERIALVGANGSGKSTLLKIINGVLKPGGGIIKIGASVKIGYMPQEQETLPSKETPLSIIQRANPMSETDGRNFLHYFLFEGDDALRQIGLLSYGERARLILARMVIEGANFLVLDEPVNHLDIPSRERFEAALKIFPGTVLAAVHDRAFINNFAERTIQIKDGEIISHLL